MKSPPPEPDATDTVSLDGYECHALTPHGRLRHELLFRYYDEFMTGRGIRSVVDIGGGSGLLARMLLEKYSDLTVVLIDLDKRMIEKGKERLSEFLAAGRVKAFAAGVYEAPQILCSLEMGQESRLVAFNHTIEYVEDQEGALRTLSQCVPEGSYLGIMYLNNSHEALRQFVYHDSIAGVLEQLEGRRLDMGHFGQALAIETPDLEGRLQEEGLTPVIEYGMRSISDLRKPDYVKQNYEELLRVEDLLGRQKDFIGLARYRLKFYRR